MRSMQFIAVAAVALASQSALAQQPTVQERVAALKAGLASSQAALRHYQWIETTTVSLKGEVKSTKQMRCYYGAEGSIQKVEISASPPPSTKPGLRGKIVANKKAELTGYMQSAVDLVKAYVPPNPQIIQSVKDAGNVSLSPVPGGTSVRLTFANYAKAGDSLGVVVDMKTNELRGLSVASYLDDPSDAVTLDVQNGKLNDGTIFQAGITLNAVAKQLTVNVTNSGYQKQTATGN